MTLRFKGESSVHYDVIIIDINKELNVVSDAEGGGDASSQGHLLFKRKEDHVINNGLLKVYRKIMEKVLVQYGKNQNDFERLVRENQIDTLYNYAITDNNIRGNIERYEATAIERPKGGDQNSILFGELSNELVDAAVEYTNTLVSYKMEHENDDLAVAYKHPAEGYANLPVLRERVRDVADRLARNEAARFDRDAYNRLLRDTRANLKQKIIDDINAANAAVIDMLHNIVNHLPTLAALAKSAR